MNPMMMNNPMAMNNPMMMNNPMAINNSMMMNNPMMMNNQMMMNNPMMMNNQMLMNNQMMMNNPMMMNMYNNMMPMNNVNQNNLFNGNNNINNMNNSNNNQLGRLPRNKITQSVGGGNFNIIFSTPSGHKTNLQTSGNITIIELLRQYMERIGLSKDLIFNGIYFLYNGRKLKEEDGNKIVGTFLRMNSQVVVLDAGNLIGA